MTTIAYRDGMIAADTGMAVGETLIGHTTKIARNIAGDLAGAAGRSGYAMRFREWFKGGEHSPPPEAKETEHTLDRGIIFRRDGTIEVHEPDGVFTIRADYYAFGTGREVALGAMAQGATAEEAVRATMKYDAYTFGMVEVLKSEE